MNVDLDGVATTEVRVIRCTRSDDPNFMLRYRGRLDRRHRLQCFVTGDILGYICVQGTWTLGSALLQLRALTGIAETDPRQVILHRPSRHEHFTQEPVVKFQRCLLSPRLLLKPNQQTNTCSRWNSSPSKMPLTVRRSQCSFSEVAENAHERR